ncbi:hypothetical protein T12_109 [Trichinella patagoniensis]|uniref:F-box domain-containing protein n=1 Tax=Trichinella patagoniensis TaxID=990121 RepID=A0A0V0YV03_9BILA|nr:hypothetical protein T12_109 [Trichinella patagoniensis]
MDSPVSVCSRLLMRLMTDNKNINAFHTSVINHEQLDCISFSLNPSRICRFRKSSRIWYSVVSGPSSAWDEREVLCPI